MELRDFSICTESNREIMPGGSIREVLASVRLKKKSFGYINRPNPG